MKKNNRQRGTQGKYAAEMKSLMTSQEKMCSQVYDCTQLKLFTLNRHMREGETRSFNLTMVADYELFEGREVIRPTYKRNPKVWEGAYINVHLDKNGHYQVHLKNLEMSKRFNAHRVGYAIITEFLTAQKTLGL